MMAHAREAEDILIHSLQWSKEHAAEYNMAHSVHSMRLLGNLNDAQS